MKIALLNIILFLSLHMLGFSIGGSYTLKERCYKSDIIVKASIVKIIRLHEGNDESYSGPHSVALAKVEMIYKGQKKLLNQVVYIPCGYSFDPSPCELEANKTHLFFLRSMGNQYFDPVDFSSIYQITANNTVVGDTSDEKETKISDEKNVSLSAFVERFKKYTKIKDNR